jgi:uncharacterized lipoprotein YbaY
MRVAGVVVLPAGTPLFRSARVHVRLLDVTLADAPAPVLAETTVAGQRRSPAEQEIPFVLHADLPADWRGDLQVAAHVDLVGDAVVRRGDLVSTVSHPVDPRGGTRCVVRVTPVG